MPHIAKDYCLKNSERKFGSQDFFFVCVWHSVRTNGMKLQGELSSSVFVHFQA